MPAHAGAVVEGAIDRRGAHAGRPGNLDDRCPRRHQPISRLTHGTFAHPPDLSDRGLSLTTALIDFTSCGGRRRSQVRTEKTWTPAVVSQSYLAWDQKLNGGDGPPLLIHFPACPSDFPIDAD